MPPHPAASQKLVSATHGANTTAKSDLLPLRLICEGRCAGQSSVAANPLHCVPRRVLCQLPHLRRVQIGTCRASLSQKACLSPQHMQHKSLKFMVCEAPVSPLVLSRRSRPREYAILTNRANARSTLDCPCHHIGDMEMTGLCLDGFRLDGNRSPASPASAGQEVCLLSLGVVWNIAQARGAFCGSGSILQPENQGVRAGKPQPGVESIEG